VYIWTNIFIPNPTKITPVNNNTTPQTPSLAWPPVGLKGAMLGSLICSLLLFFICCCCYFCKEEEEENEGKRKGNKEIESAINS
jgi:hypothetical protein